MPNPFEHQEIRDWWFSAVAPSGVIEDEIYTHGSGPFEEYEFDAFLRQFGIRIVEPSTDLTTLVIGQKEWDSEVLSEIIEARRGQHLLVYSQEMLLALLSTGKDPLDSPRIARAFGEGHPVLKYIQDWGFDWPNAKSTFVPGASGDVETVDWEGESLLKLMGYTAGAKGRDQGMRREILRRAFLENPPSVSDTQYLNQWAEPGSGTRLYKMAERITLNINLQTPKPQLQEAVRHWREDLAWLRSEFYDGKHTFHWPYPNV